MGPPNHKQTMPVNNPSPSGFSNSKQIAPADSPDPLNCKQITTSDSSSITHADNACASENLLLVKKQKHFNMSLLPNHIK